MEWTRMIGLWPLAGGLFPEVKRPALSFLRGRGRPRHRRKVKRDLHQASKSSPLAKLFVHCYVSVIHLYAVRLVPIYLYSPLSYFAFFRISI